MAGMIRKTIRPRKAVEELLQLTASKSNAVLFTKTVSISLLIPPNGVAVPLASQPVKNETKWYDFLKAN